MKSFDLAIIGGGVIGAACARAAALRGVSVALFEPGPEPGAASPASAGMLAAQIELGAPDTLRLALRARSLYAALAPTLLERTGIDIGLWEGGIASVALDENTAAGLEHQAMQQRQAGLRCEWLGAEAALERWPGLSPECRGALLAPEDGAVDPQALTRALLGAARQRGVELIKERVTTLRIESQRVRGVTTASGAVAAGHVVVAAGAWSPAILGVVAGLAVEPVRGQMAATPWPRAGGMPAAILYHNHSYVLARGAEAVLGSTMERAGFDNRVTNEGLAHILGSAVQLLPGLLREPVLRMWSGLRPLTPDGQPIVGQDPAIQGLWYATGHGRNGVLLAALTGEVVADLVCTGRTSEDIASWRPDRHRSAEQRAHVSDVRVL